MTFAAWDWYGVTLSVSAIPVKGEGRSGRRAARSLFGDKLVWEEMRRVTIGTDDDLTGTNHPSRTDVDGPSSLLILLELLDGRPGEQLDLTRFERRSKEMRGELVRVDRPCRAL